MLEVLVPLAALAGGGVVAYLWYRVRLQQQSRERLALDLAGGEGREPKPPLTGGYLPRHRLIPWLVGALAGVTLYYLVHLHPAFAVTLGLIVGLLGSQLEAMLASRKTRRIEEQLGDAIDLMVGNLRAGSSVLASLESAAGESRAPLRPQLEEVLGRIRYGDDPQAVLRALVARVPLESFRLFAAALSVHWEVGGSLAPTLATVGRTIRDRNEIARRIHSLTAEGRFSVIAVLCVTYFIALLMWRTDPGRMEQFLGTPLGRGAVVAAMVLQALGIAWTARLSRVKF